MLLVISSLHSPSVILLHFIPEYLSLLATIMRLIGQLPHTLPNIQRWDEPEPEKHQHTSPNLYLSLRQVKHASTPLNRQLPLHRHNLHLHLPPHPTLPLLLHHLPRSLRRPLYDLRLPAPQRRHVLGFPQTNLIFRNRDPPALR